MFAVKITPDAKRFLDAKLRELELPRPGVMVFRQGPKADIVRTPSGEPLWSIEHPHPWAIDTGSFETYPDSELMIVDGIRVHLALTPRNNETGVLIRLREGDLFVEALGA